MEEEVVEIMQPRFWQKNGWMARVIKNEDDDGWAVAMTRVGDSEPVLVGPWTMGRDKKNPKPLDFGAFNTLVKTANDVMTRHRHAAHARLHKVHSYTNSEGQPVYATLDIVPDEDDPHAILSCVIETTKEELRKGRVVPNFKMTAATLERFIKSGE